MEIREATAKDFDDIVYIWLEYLLNNYQFFTTNKVNNQGRLVVNDLTFKSFILTAEGQVIGGSRV